MHLSEDINHRPLIILRFNTDQYISDGEKINSCFAKSKIDGLYKVSKPEEWLLRCEVLLDMIEYHANNIPERTITVEYIFYDD